MMQSNSFSTFDESQEYTYDHHSYSSYSSSSSSFVDCTLSLGTPSTRLSDDHNQRPAAYPERRRSSSFISNLFGKTPSQSHKSGSRGGSGSSNGSGGDPLFARRCANCDTTSTPLWRNGPHGPKSLCNACGIRFKKEERRASAAAAAAGNNGAAMEAQHVMNSSWVQHPQMPCYSPAYGDEFNYTQEDEDGNAEAGTSSFISWHRPPSFINDSTR